MTAPHARRYLRDAAGLIVRELTLEEQRAHRRVYQQTYNHTEQAKAARKRWERSAKGKASGRKSYAARKLRRPTP